ncbi:MAG: hypothetical protein AAB865_02855 [Patescibacteria group bacterium]
MFFHETRSHPEITQIALEAGTETDEALVPCVEDEHVPAEIKEQVTNKGIQLMREALFGIEEYAVFASTAMYLYGEQHEIKELQTIPGDFDGVVRDEATLKLVRERLQNLPGIEFEREGRFGVIKRDEARILSGTLHIETGAQHMPVVRYPFEFFTVDSKIIPPNVFRKRQRLQGLNVLSLEGLQNQYINNLSFETSLHRRVSEIIAYLIKPEVRSGPATSPEVLEQLALPKEKIVAFYDHYDALVAKGLELDNINMDPQLNKLLSGGHKTKIPKRLKNIEQLKKMQTVT